MAKLPVLMYHNVTNDLMNVNRLTIHSDYLEEQFKYLVANKYKTHHLGELKKMTSLSDKNVVLTFDDVTVNQLEYAVPLLEKYNLKATFFVPFAYLGKSDEWNEGKEKIMTIEQLRSLPSLVELGHHSYMHRVYSNLSAEEIREDFTACFSICEYNNLNVFKGVAFPYGDFPKKEPAKSIFFTHLMNNSMEYGFRIGNKVNNFPFKNPYEVHRIDVRGNESMFKFKLNLLFGKLF